MLEYSNYYIIRLLNVLYSILKTSQGAAMENIKKQKAGLLYIILTVIIFDCSGGAKKDIPLTDKLSDSCITQPTEKPEVERRNPG